MARKNTDLGKRNLDAFESLFAKEETHDFDGIEVTFKAPDAPTAMRLRAKQIELASNTSASDDASNGELIKAGAEFQQTCVAVAMGISEEESARVLLVRPKIGESAQNFLLGSADSEVSEIGEEPFTQ